MREITLEGLTDEQLQSEAQLLINMLRTKYPKLDLRRGTVLRDLLVDADAAVGTMFSLQADEQRLASSLLELSKRAEAGESVDAADVNAILSNFDMESNTGTKARGSVQVYVSSNNRHTLLAGARFHTVDGVHFVSTSDVEAVANPSGNQVRQYEGVSNWWYLVPVEAEEVGAAGNISQGTALEPDSGIADFVSAAAFATFSEGSDLETLDTTVARIKNSLSVRALTSGTSVEAILRDRFDETDNPIVAVSLCGYANRAQLRDKHNLFGTAVGGRVDVYVRNFTGIPVTSALVKTGTLLEVNKDDEGNDLGTADFEFTVGHDEVPGIIAPYLISDADAKSLSSYRYKVAYAADVSSTWHDFRVAEPEYGPNAYETANTVWRDAVITVQGVPYTPEEFSAGQKDFRVVMTRLPVADEIQDLVDDGLVRNEGADYVVRGPMIVNMGVKAVVRYSYATGFDVSKAVAALSEYVNTRGFVGRVTRSEVAAVCSKLGAVSVDLFDESDMLYGYVYDAFGIRHDLSGDALDIDNVEAPEAMLTKDTAVFVLEPKNIQITTIAVD